MTEYSINENKAIRILFQKLTDEKYKERECKNVFVITLFPKGYKQNKFIDFEENVLKTNEYNIVSKFALSASKLYLYDNNIYLLDDDYLEGIRFIDYTKDINRFIDDLIYNLSVDERRMYLVFNELKIGMEISNWQIKIMDFGCNNLRLVLEMFKSEGLFISNEYCV